MDVAVSTSDLHAEGSHMENTSAEMSPAACQANVGGRTPDSSLESPLGRPNMPWIYGPHKLHNITRCGYITK